MTYGAARSRIAHAAPVDGNRFHEREDAESRAQAQVGGGLARDARDQGRAAEIELHVRVRAFFPADADDGAGEDVADAQSAGARERERHVARADADAQALADERLDV